MARHLGYAAATLISLVLIVGSLAHRLPLDPTEVLGFVSGGLCVWLTVRQNIWNWPIGIANNVFFLILFLRAHLFADMGLQIIYIVLSVAGWYWWLRGGPAKSALAVARTSARTGFVLAVLLIACTLGMTIVLRRIDDAAPFWDALTTVLSLIAQYLLTRKLIENWYVWIAADELYVALYCYKGLYLTAGLYAIFMVMCCAGLAQWHASRPTPHAATERTMEVAGV